MVGLGVFDALARDLPDPDTGEVYPALSCCNDPAMAERCAVPGAPKVIWSIKASAAMNSECALLLREGFRSGKIRLLETEYDGEVELAALDGFDKLSPASKAALLLPYVETTLLVDEAVKLLHEESAGRVKVFERSGARKDRYSSIAYNYYVAAQIEARLVRRKNISSGESSMFLYKAPKIRRGR